LTRDRSLVAWIVAFKAIKAIALTALGIVLLAARRTDPADLLVRAVMAFHLPLTSRLLDRLLTLAAHFTITRPTALAVTAFGYAALMGAEGLALYFRKRWARWFTIVATGSLIPLEVYEIVRRPHVMRVLVLVVNIAVVIYLAKRTDLMDD
jgi:uncharacterized membrane protein (DUF2068 family)